MIDFFLSPSFYMKDLEKEKRRLAERYLENGIIHSKRVIEAFLKVPRELFVLDPYKNEAYMDVPLPTLKGQTISAPHMSLILLELLDLQPHHKVLEIGTGTGYQAALIATLVPEGKVITIERIRALAELARKNLRRLELNNVEVIWGDGLKGYPKEAPYDRILIAASVKEIPKTLIDQLKPYGKLVAPVKKDFRNERLVLVEKLPGGKLKSKRLMPVAFVDAKEGIEE